MRRRSQATQHLGEFEELVLLAIAGLGDGAYTVSIQQQIERRAGRSATLGAIYTALSRLHEKGCVASELGEVTRQRGGKRKRLYTITDVGEAALCEARQARNRLWADVTTKPAWVLS